MWQSQIETDEPWWGRGHQPYALLAPGEYEQQARASFSFPLHSLTLACTVDANRLWQHSQCEPSSVTAMKGWLSLLPTAGTLLVLADSGLVFCSSSFSSKASPALCEQMDAAQQASSPRCHSPIFWILMLIFDVTMFQECNQEPCNPMWSEQFIDGASSPKQ